MERVSNCCGAPSFGEINNALGLCSDCKEWAEFLTEEEIKEYYEMVEQQAEAYDPTSNLNF